MLVKMERQIPVGTETDLSIWLRAEVSGVFGAMESTFQCVLIFALKLAFVFGSGSFGGSFRCNWILGQIKI